MSKEEFDLIYPHMPKSGKLLEIGSYPFERTKELIELGYNVFGVDLNYDMPESNIRKCDIESEALPFKDNSFDIVLMMQVIEHLGKNPVWALKEINRVLKIGNSLFLSTPNFFSLANIKCLILKGKPNDSSFMTNEGYTGHVHIYTKNELKMFLGYCKLNVKEHRYLWYKSERFKIGGIITYLFPFLRDHHLFICEGGEKT